MSHIQSAILGFLQGATEFLPVSSSAHLVIGQHLLGLEMPGVMLEVLLHLGTLLSVLIYFRRDIGDLFVGTFSKGSAGREARQEVGLIIVATLPAVLVALFFKDAVDALFDSLIISGVMLLATTAILLSSKWATVGNKSITLQFAVIIGLAQAVAIMPGISRSGITIVTGLWLGVSGTSAARFSFLMAIPAILGAAVLNLGTEMSIESLPAMGTGLVVSALVGYAVIAWLMDILRRGQLYFFAGYTLLAGLIVIFAL